VKVDEAILEGNFIVEYYWRKVETVKVEALPEDNFIVEYYWRNVTVNVNEALLGENLSVGVPLAKGGSCEIYRGTSGRQLYSHLIRSWP